LILFTEMIGKVNKLDKRMKRKKFLTIENLKLKKFKLCRISMNIKRKEEFIYLMTVLREKNRNHDIKMYD